MKYLFLIFFIISCAHSKKEIIAHRGAPGYLPEHTLEGVTLAHSWGVDFIEPDVVITKDSQAVVLHDIHLDTTTNVAEIYPKRKRKDGRYYAIDFSLKEIKELSVSERISLKTKKTVFPDRFTLNKSQFEVPTLKDYIELVQELNKTRNKNIGIYPELKSPEFHEKHGKDIAKIVLDILDSYGYNSPSAPIYLQCFYPPTLKRLKEELGAKMKLIALIAEPEWNETSWDYDKMQTEEGIVELSKYVDGIGPHIPQLYTVDEDGNRVSSELVRYAKRLKLKIHPYTHRPDALPKGFKNSDELFEFLYDDIEVDGIFSDFADQALKYLE